MALYLIRHARAGERTPRTDDLLRSLDADGQLQAKAIAVALGDRPITRIIASPASRCQQTVRPLADALGLPVEVDDALWEGEHARARALLDCLLAEEAETALCTHGDIIPGLLWTLERRGLKIPHDKCAKGSIWTLVVTNGQVSAAHYQKHP